MIKKRALLIGDITKAKYHPLTGFHTLIPSFIPLWDVDISIDYEDFTYEHLSNYDAFIVMIDQWTPLSDTQTFGILQAIKQGIGMLVIHQGISLQARSELLGLLQARFTHHPEETMLSYNATTPVHPIMTDVCAFSIQEEPYMFEMASPSSVELFLQYRYQDQLFPAGWTNHYGLGRICYLAFGHHLESMYNSNVQKIIHNSLNWLINQI